LAISLQKNNNNRMQKCDFIQFLTEDKLGFNNMITDGVPNQPCHRVTVDFPHDVGAMCFCRLGANVQGNTDLLTAVSFCQELHNLSFSTGQAQSLFASSLLWFLQACKKLIENLWLERCREI